MSKSSPYSGSGAEAGTGVGGPRDGAASDDEVGDEGREAVDRMAKSMEGRVRHGIVGDSQGKGG